jgi:excisionase family DNA binding protein
MSARRGRSPKTFSPESLSALAFADETDEIRTAEVAGMLGVARHTVRVWIHQGELAARKDPDARRGCVYLVRVSDLKAFVEGSRRGDVA